MNMKVDVTPEISNQKVIMSLIRRLEESSEKVIKFKFFDVVTTLLLFYLRLTSTISPSMRSRPVD